ncbi:hypothetical protein LTR10_019593 [Elasticomyces elasticus]|uniref:Uncharacterized protein n=1 Tax=Exophiala sideris TaxID=1016849 RepID=A0ABR0JNR9_9EURO|nr:hypothetical protein LTR10_019593 [Elasticomyces elasticus]KAK5038141.1 hypothetical protein LTS07_001610 [Exophiala sideris]KAK5044125.1 hypothetical protein LTR13_000481 [Exophiala sideris]KAK5067625.1 hypothetical protein LTR69_001614 [Exophiala sideris]KAK5184136.1 hypothetical protein LTR44_003642 [Eurotiomycetes sp. CCFEE 6388]
MNATSSKQSTSTLTSIFNSLSSLHPKTSQSNTQTPAAHITPLQNLCPQDTARARSLFLTLHVLFPHELIPALDLLDRGLVTRLKLQQDDSNASPSRHAGTEIPEVQGELGVDVYYIQSSSSLASANHSRKHASSAAMFYEVRLDSWNCSCPAFSVSAFQGLNYSATYNDENYAHDKDNRLSNPGLDSMTEDDTKWRFGGVATSRAASGLFGHGVTVRTVTGEEIVGWGGGWGEFGGG